MKKLIIVVAVALAAVCTQAATVRWQSGALKAPTTKEGAKGTANVTATNARGYMFAIDATTYAALLATDYATTAANVWGQFGTGDKLNATTLAANATQVSTGVSLGAINIVDSEVTDSVGNLYAAVIYTYSDTTLGDFYIANVGTVDVGGSATYSATNLGTTFTGSESPTTIGSWTAVPEPTSGLLLLLGMAGLALKRKRA